MSKTIEEIKENYANEQGRDTWYELFSWNELYHTGIDKMQYHHDQIAKRYAQSKTQELQEQNAKLVDMLIVTKNILEDIFECDVSEIDALLTKHNHLNKKP